MNFELQAGSEAGRRFVSLAETHAADFATRAAQHDREGSFAFENIEAMKKSGYMAGPVPRDFGGLGVESLHDMMVGMSRLGRGDASTAIATNMHVAGAAVIVRLMRRSHAQGEHKTVAILEGLLRQVGAGAVVMCFPTTEPGTDLNTPFTEATPTQGGYLLNGRKIFGTISPAAQLFFPSVRVPTEGGGYLTATAVVPSGAKGLEVLDNWDAMGMRASGSNDIVFTQCFVPEDMLFGKRDNYGKVGRGFADFALNANVPLIATFLGISEAARDFALATMKNQRKGQNKKLLAERIPIQHLIAEIEIDLAISRAVAERVGRAADTFLEKYATTDAPPDESTALMKEVQCMKYTVNRKAIEIVDRAMTVCGGAAYMNKHLLTRLYRDARAGPFMQPFAPYEAFEYIGKVALGIEPILDR
ncbi:acyl-CoA dehydrogenase [Corallococcus sp. CA053C]|uniref:acyl-CoA dehydrogenase family protein n=1 Tax=Corallococcus sp. CA053C TaxID=2316732 RepID=UPI000EA32246|nr:acyl-CoA dehydrogenase family protein [Corallococcus sp. CA053C]RKH05137.1 acyl-CoA dehydrogenase [Corallococcus sp. CA053C]